MPEKAGAHGKKERISSAHAKQKNANRLSASILNYFAAFTEIRFNFRTLINYRWTDNELTLDLGIFQDFQDEILQKIETGDSTPLTVKKQ